MKRKIVTLLGVAALSCAIMTGCGSKDAQTEAPAQETEETAEADTTKADAAEETKEADTEEAEATTEEAEETAAPLEDGVYTAEFNTDSGMFHVNEANDGKGVLTVENGKMTIHVSLASKKIVNLYPVFTDAFNCFQYTGTLYNGRERPTPKKKHRTHAKSQILISMTKGLRCTQSEMQSGSICESDERSRNPGLFLALPSFLFRN